MFIPRDDGTYVVANTLSGAILHIDEQPFLDKLKKFLDKDSHYVFDYDKDDEMHQVFYEHGIFAETGVNEYEMALYQYEQTILKSNVLSLTLLPTRQCNFRCVYCYEDLQDKYMTDSVYRNLLTYIDKSLEKNLHSAVQINLFGGEPFLPFDKVIAFLKQAKEICKNHDVPFTASATTNFSLVTPERFDALATVNCEFFQITLDGLALTHDARKCKADGSPSFETIVSNLLYAKSTGHDFKITIRSNFDEEMTTHAKDFYSFIKENFNDPRFSVSYINMQKWGGQNDSNLNILTNENLVESKIQIAKIVASLELKNEMKNVFSQPFHSLCYASKPNMFIIDYDGAILKCTLKLDDDFNKIGQVEEEGVFNILHQKHAPWVVRYNFLNDKCEECNILPICFGGLCPLGKVQGKQQECNKKEQQANVYNQFKYSVGM